jgi:mono/diheme cytochrome c family protein
MIDLRRLDRFVFTVMVLLTVALLAGCTRGSTSRRPPIHLNPNMDDQPKVKAQSASGFFYDGKSMRDAIPGTVAIGSLDEPDSFKTGRFGTGDGAGFVTANPLFAAHQGVAGQGGARDAILERGAERYDIYCALCHGASGNGNGMLRQRSGVAVADLTEPRLVGESDGYLFDVITNGFGLMAGYAYPVEPRDRWAIVAHVRELQASASEGAADGAVEGEPAVPEPARDGEEPVNQGVTGGDTPGASPLPGEPGEDPAVPATDNQEGEPS